MSAGEPRDAVARAGAVVAGWFVRSVDGPDRAVRPRPAPPPLEEPVVLAGGAAALGLGAITALRAAPRGPAVLACWGVPAAARRRDGLATAAARRLAASLRARDLEPTAAGRLVVVLLPADEDAALTHLRRAEGACGAAPCVLLLGAARGPAWEPVLAERRVALLHGADPDITALSAARLEAAGLDARIVAAPSPLARAWAVGGWALPGTAPRPRPAEVLR